MVCFFLAFVISRNVALTVAGSHGTNHSMRADALNNQECLDSDDVRARRTANGEVHVWSMWKASTKTFHFFSCVDCL